VRPDFGSFSGSQGPPSLTQPNHGHFGTDVGSSHIQWLKDRSKGGWFERRPVRRSKLGANEMFGTGSVGECAIRHAPLDRHGRGHLPDGVASQGLCLSQLSRDRPHGVHRDLVGAVERAIRITAQDLMTASFLSIASGERRRFPLSGNPKARGGDFGPFPLRGNPSHRRFRLAARHTRSRRARAGRARCGSGHGADP
jgi:hypothetical protein